jgi:cytosine/adenosine deaminase-related metal-dependent hydrolase
MKHVLAEFLFTQGKILGKQIIKIDDSGCFQGIAAEGTIVDEYWEGLIFSGFINTHCHLELSHLEGAFDMHTGLVDFILQVQSKRHLHQDKKIAAMQLMDAKMLEQGIVAVGDICNTKDSFAIKQQSKIHYHSFIEQIGFVPGREQQIIAAALLLKQEALDLNLSASITPHAPYSVSPNLFYAIANLHEQVYSMHHLESAEEIIFFEQKKGDFVKLYEQFEINIDFFEGMPGNTTPYWLNSFRVPKLILVHNTFMKLSLDLIPSIIPEVHFCLCPNANLFIENTLPDVQSIMAQSENICIGTDSIASNHQLSVLEEIKTLDLHFPGIGLEKLMTWATINGAKALGLTDRYGDFIPGKTNQFFALKGFRELQSATVLVC